MTNSTPSYTDNNDTNIVRIFLIRHGQTDHNVKKILQGHRDISLNLTGIKQAQQLGEYLKEEGITFEKVYSSDLKRCQETTQEILKLSNQEGLKVVLNSDLRERFMGPIEGMHISDAEKYADKHGRGTFKDFGEDAVSFLGRLQRGVNSSVEDSTLNGLKNVALVSHGGAIRGILGWLQQQDGADASKIIVFNTSVTVIDYVIPDKKYHVKSVGNTRHLGEGNFMVSDLRLR
ncbi:hypothetical protein C6P44_005121 [Monosporozyma unispora]|nr:hypothetical protein C6P44_005121 [Kazachstania unispora]